MSDNAAPAGSSTYDSGTMYVGDGTWIASKNTFLLPNLQGLNFATMQYNSMSNRFAALPQYRRLILGHGVLAALVFLLVVPSAIFIARFYYRNPRLALRLHIWLQILTVGLLTVVFILGNLAVGPQRSLTNPHHGIGVALYTLIMVQALGGGLVHHFEKGKMRWRLPLKLMLHQWLGRATALLGVVQIPLGLTLYGSPKYLFILYALVVFGWALLYFILTYLHRPVIGNDGYDSESYVSGPTRTGNTDDGRTARSGSHLARNTGLFGAGLAGLTAMRHRSRSKRRNEERSRTGGAHASPSGLGSRHSVAYTEDEKYSSHDRPQEKHTWRNRILGAGAGLGAYAGVKRLFSRSKARDEETYVGSYQAPSDVTQSIDRSDISRVQQGQAPMSPGDPRASKPTRTDGAAFASPGRQRPRSRRSEETSMSDDSDSMESYRGDRPLTGEHGVREGVATLGVLGYLREKRRERRDKKEQRRVNTLRRHEQTNAEHINRANSRRYTDRPTNTDRRRHSMAETTTTNDHDVTGSNPELSRNHRNPTNPSADPTRSAAGPTSATTDIPSAPVHLGYDPNLGVAPPPNTMQYPPTTTAGYPVSAGPVSMPPGAVEPDPSRLVGLPLPQGPAPTPYSPLRPDSHLRSRSHQGRRNSASVGGTSHSPASVVSPPVSVKVQMHKDGRHVTLRRLNEDEAAAERDSRRQERRQRRRRAESLSSGVEDEGTRFRRNEAIRPASNLPITNAPRPPDELNLPPAVGPPPVPAHSLSPQGPAYYSAQAAPSGLTSGVGSPGTYDTATGTDLSAYDSNRRRRRAERAAVRQQRAAAQGSRVEFS